MNNYFDKIINENKKYFLKYNFKNYAEKQKNILKENLPKKSKSLDDAKYDDPFNDIHDILKVRFDLTDDFEDYSAAEKRYERRYKKRR